MTFCNPLIYKGLGGLKNPNNINNIKRHGGAALKSARLLQWGRKRAYRERTGNGPGGPSSLQANEPQTANQGRMNGREIEGAGVASSIQAKGQTAA